MIPNEFQMLFRMSSKWFQVHFFRMIRNYSESKWFRMIPNTSKWFPNWNQHPLGDSTHGFKTFHHKYFFFSILACRHQKLSYFFIFFSLAINHRLTFNFNQPYNKSLLRLFKWRPTFPICQPLYVNLTT